MDDGSFSTNNRVLLYFLLYAPYDVSWISSLNRLILQSRAMMFVVWYGNKSVAWLVVCMTGTFLKFSNTFYQCAETPWSFCSPITSQTHNNLYT
jgi:hypothetical protein